MLSGPAAGEKGALKLDGHPVCQKSFRSLLGVGKHRMGRLRSAALQGSETCPMDQRFLPQAGWAICWSKHGDAKNDF